MKITVFEIKFEPRDIWIGVYWDFNEYGYLLDLKWSCLDIYICIIPLLPIHIHITDFFTVK